MAHSDVRTFEKKLREIDTIPESQRSRLIDLIRHLVEQAEAIIGQEKAHLDPEK